MQNSYQNATEAYILYKALDTRIANFSFTTFLWEFIKIFGFSRIPPFQFTAVKS